MERRPWPIVILAIFNLLIPVISVLKIYFASYFPLTIFLKALFLPENILLTIHIILPSLLAAISIYAVKKWSYHTFLLAMLWIISRNIYNYAYANDISALQLIWAMLFNIMIVSYFLLPAIKEAYMNPKLRWWEAKTRYKKSMLASFRQEAGLTNGTISNISEGGVFVAGPIELAMNQALHLVFTVDNFHFDLAGEVVYQLPQQQGYGIQFLNLQRQQKKQLKQFIGLLEKQKVPITRPLRPWTEDFKEWLIALIPTGPKAT